MDGLKRFKSECRAYKRMKARSMQEIGEQDRPYGTDMFRNREILLAKECTGHVEEVFERISGMCTAEEKEMLWEHFVGGMSISETAERHGIPYYTLKAKTKRIVRAALEGSAES